MKPSIWLKEHRLAIAPRFPVGKRCPTPTLGTPPGEDGLTPTLETDLGTLVGPINQTGELGMKIAAIIGSRDSVTD
jgi:hypothetical protein